MSGITILSEGTRKARKHHQCYECYRSIGPGQVYEYQTCKYDYVYTLKFHKDCRAASLEYCRVNRISPWDFDFGGYPPLADIISDGGEFKTDVDAMRGKFPHVACRLELTEQLAEARLLDKLRAMQESQ